MEKNERIVEFIVAGTGETVFYYPEEKKVTKVEETQWEPSEAAFIKVPIATKIRNQIKKIKEDKNTKEKTFEEKRADLIKLSPRFAEIDVVKFIADFERLQALKSVNERFKELYKEYGLPSRLTKKAITKALGILCIDSIDRRGELKEEEKQDIYERKLRGETTSSIAVRYNVSSKYIPDIVNKVIKSKSITTQIAEEEAIDTAPLYTSSAC